MQSSRVKQLKAIRGSKIYADTKVQYTLQNAFSVTNVRRTVAASPTQDLLLPMTSAEHLGRIACIARPIAAHCYRCLDVAWSIGADFWFEVPGQSSVGLIGGGRGQWLGGTMASTEHEPIMGVWGQSPQRGPGAEQSPWSRGSGGRSPPEAESILVIGCPTEPANLAPLIKFSKQSCNVHFKNQSTAMKGTGAKRNVCPGSCVSTGAKFPVAPVESAPMAWSVWLSLCASVYYSIPIRDSNRFYSIRYANRFESILFL